MALSLKIIPLVLPVAEKLTFGRALSGEKLTFGRARLAEKVTFKSEHNAKAGSSAPPLPGVMSNLGQGFVQHNKVALIPWFPVRSPDSSLHN